MRFQTGRFYGQGHNANINRAILQLLDDFVAEVPVDANLHAGIEAAVFSKDIGQHVQAGGLVGPDYEGATRRDPLVGDREQRFVAQAEEPLGIAEQNSARRCKPDIFPGAVKELVTVLLFELPNLGADGRLRTEYFLPRARKTPQLVNLHKGCELIEI